VKQIHQELTLNEPTIPVDWLILTSSLPISVKKTWPVPNVFSFSFCIVRTSGFPQYDTANFFGNLHLVRPFFDKSRIISDNEMQNLWAQVLAGEANSLGTYSKRTVNFLSSLDKKDAELFQILCRYCCWIIDSLVPLIFDIKNDIYDKNGINFESLIHLDSIGLIHFEINGFIMQNTTKKFTVSYYGKLLDLTIQNENTLGTGQVFFTEIGKELVKISQLNSE
jgi:hypothetical protein